MKNVKTLATICLISFFGGCGLFDSSSDRIVDDYTITWIDVKSNRHLSKYEQLIPSYVFAVGHDKKYIYAKQHPLNSEGQINETITNYYIIERTKNEFQDKPQYGPLTKEEFDARCVVLGIKKIDFDMIYTSSP